MVIMHATKCTVGVWRVYSGCVAISVRGYMVVMHATKSSMLVVDGAVVMVLWVSYHRLFVYRYWYWCQ
jgi:hypothetical protein